LMKRRGPRARGVAGYSDGETAFMSLCSSSFFPF